MSARLLVFAAALVVAGPVLAITPDEAKQKIEKAYGVQVLKVAPTEIDGRPAFAVRAMEKDTRTNGGFGVTTLIVDAESGQLVPAFRHQPSGYTLPETVSGDPHEVNVPEHGFKTWR
jgi:hypothetical protein